MRKKPPSVTITRSGDSFFVEIPISEIATVEKQDELEPNVLTYEEAAKLANCSAAYIKKLASTGVLPKAGMGGGRMARVRRSDVLRLARKRRIDNPDNNVTNGSAG